MVNERERESHSTRLVDGAWLTTETFRAGNQMEAGANGKFVFGLWQRELEYGLITDAAHNVMLVLRIAMGSSFTSNR